MPVRAITIIILLVVVSGLILWDVYAKIRSGDNTISAVIQETSFRYPIVIFALCGLMGHFCGFVTAPAYAMSRGILVIAAITGFLAGFVFAPQHYTPDEINQIEGKDSPTQKGI